MKFKIIICLSFSTPFHSDPTASFCVGFSVRSGKHYRFPFVYVNVNIFKNIIS